MKLAAILTLAAASAAQAQISIPWFTVDGGGGSSSGGSFTIRGTIGQPDAGVMTGGQYTVSGGFWAGIASSHPCAADFNTDGSVDLFDYLDFLSYFAIGDFNADFNHDSVVDFFDYLDFVDAFAAGC
jgi:hypothetical protein